MEQVFEPITVSRSEAHSKIQSHLDSCVEHPCSCVSFSITFAVCSNAAHALVSPLSTSTWSRCRLPSFFACRSCIFPVCRRVKWLFSRSQVSSASAHNAEMLWSICGMSSFRHSVVVLAYCSIFDWYMCPLSCCMNIPSICRAASVSR